MLEEGIFRKWQKVDTKILDYGFQKENDHYVYYTTLMDGFQAIIQVFMDSSVKGKVIDQGTMEEYVNFRIESQNGEFVASVRQAFTDLLYDIRGHCFEPVPFVSKQANRIAAKIKEKYGVLPEFLWKKDEDSGVFRHRENRKWFGIIQYIRQDRIRAHSQGRVNILNVKLDDQCAKRILEPGYYPAYHMNKKSWVSICLDDTLSDDQIMEDIDISYQISYPNSSWIVPANAKYFDMVHIFDKEDTTLWKQSVPMKIGDIVYLYVSAPYSSIFYQCEVIETDREYLYQDANIHMDTAMRLRLKKRYDPTDFTLDILKKYGVKSIRGPRHLPNSLLKMLET